ncbi:hypothetical protein CEY12_08790 [Chryseobacterium sp. T16E-39]|uniref:hypothetical protein n=1 Tax=Chryseobacterium sp. T16E-39 TaxID=2015076 RepID=UPI000B5B23EF|nr:hypothetical protein [Chryseobacterium sp. T16E-39]ASK30201.1 hypothetical protein CEY12_08790 [Chryseobacterium sp. T16E-39]
MKLKYFLCGLLLLIVNSLISAQIRANVSSKSYDLKSVDITIGDMIITIDDDGSIAGFNSISNGNIDYYDDQYMDRDKLGKIKKIGNYQVDYFDRFDMDNNGKVKSIGDITIAYWDRFDKEKEGKVKKIGNLSVDYWDKDIIDNSKFGKLKVIGNISIDYGGKEIIDQSKYEKLVKFGNVTLDYWSDTIMDKRKFGKIKSIEGNSQDVAVVIR